MTEFYPLPKNKGEANTKACDTSSVSVRGRLKKCLPFWQSLETSKFLLDLIESGYKIPSLLLCDACIITILCHYCYVMLVS